MSILAFGPYVLKDIEEQDNNNTNNDNETYENDISKRP